METLAGLSFVSGVAWGIYPLLNKFVLEDSNTNIMTIFGLFTVFIGCFGVLFSIHNRSIILKDIQTFSNKHWFLLILSALIIVFANYLFNYSSIFISPYKTLAISFSIASIVSMILSYFYFKIPITVTDLISILIIITCIYVINYQLKK
jgi:drug/metabolite transporter (DMT)-like permease